MQVLRRESAQLEEGAATDEGRAEFNRKIERLGELLDNGKLLRGSGGALTIRRAHANVKLSRGEANAELLSRLTAAGQLQSELRARLLEHVQGAAHIDHATAAAAVAANAIDSRGGGAAAAAAAAAAAETSGSPATGAAMQTASNEDESSAIGSTGLRRRGATVTSDSSGGGGGCGSNAAGAHAMGGYESKSEAQALEMLRGIHEALVDDTAQMVMELKAKSMAARKAVTEDIRALDVAEGKVFSRTQFSHLQPHFFQLSPPLFPGVLEANRIQLEKSNERLREQLQHMRSSTCYVWLLMLFVCVVFIFMYLLMKTFKKKM